MTFLNLIVIIFIVFICSYALVNRICQCKEYCATNAAYASYVNKEATVQEKDIMESIQRFTKDGLDAEEKHVEK